MALLPGGNQYFIFTVQSNFLFVNSKYSLITGAAKGLGRAFAYELAGRKFNTILIDLPGTGLDNLCHEIKNISGMDSVYFETDMSIKENIVILAAEINSHYDVFLLINNVGAGGAQKFDEADVEYINRMIQLNVMATSIMTHQLIPNLKKQDKAYLLNVSSMAAFSPMAYKTVYPASKAYINYFSRSLCEEFRATNIFVSTVCPGPMKTNADTTRRINGQNAVGRLGLLSTKQVAGISVRQLLRRKKVIIPNFANRMNWLVMKIVPSCISLPLISRAMKKEAESEWH